MTIIKSSALRKARDSVPPSPTPTARTSAAFRNAAAPQEGVGEQGVTKLWWFEYCDYAKAIANRVCGCGLSCEGVMTRGR